MTLCQAHPLKDRGDELYQTPEVATEAMLKVEKLPHTLWECACGPGALARVLRAHGHKVIATDLVNYESPDQDLARIDFLIELQAPPGVECIVTNPPFKLAGKFVEHALTLCPKVVMLLRLAFLESERRSNILDGGKLARVYPFRNRLPFMHRDGWEGRRATSSVCFAWFVWDRDHNGDAAIRRISWEKP